MYHRNQAGGIGDARSAFTLTELLVVISIIGVVTSALAFVVAGAQTRARESRTETQMQRIESVLQREIQELLEVRIPVRMPMTGDFPNGLGPHRTQPEGTLSRMRRFWNEARRVDLLSRFPYRYELVVPANPQTVGRPNAPGLGGMPTVYFQRNNGSEDFQPFFSVPTDLQAVRNMALGGMDLSVPTPANPNPRKTNSSELLFAILKRIWIDGEPALTFIRDSEIVDTDGDGFPEIVDAWGDPIYFRLEIQIPVTRTVPGPPIEGLYNMPLDQYSAWMTQFQHNGQTFVPLSVQPDEFSPDRVRIRLFSKNMDPTFDPDSVTDIVFVTF